MGQWKKIEENKMALRLFDKGELSMGKIAEIVGVGRDTVHRWISENREKEKVAGGIYSTSKIKLMKEAFTFFDEGLSYTEVSKRLSVSITAAKLWRERNERNKNNIYPSDFDDNDILDLLREGFSPYKIQIKTGWSITRINKIKLYVEKEDMI